MRRKPLSLILASGAVVALGLSPSPSLAGQKGPTAVIRVEQAGGFVGPNVIKTRLPELVLYSDGQLLIPGALHGSVREIYQGKLTPTQLRSQTTLFSRAILVPFGGWGIPGVSDLPTTEISLLQGGRASKASVYALGFSRGSLTSNQIKARAYLARSIARLTALAGKSATYRATQYEAWSLWPDPALSPAPTPDPAANLWPVGVTQPVPGCLALPAKPFASLLSHSTSSEWLLPSGERITVTWRPVLPGEIACKR